MTKDDFKIYVGCSLTHASEEFRQSVEVVKNELRNHKTILDFLGLEAGTEENVYLHDIENVKACDLFVAICDHPSLGLGYELATAVEKYGKPTLAVAHADTKVTRMILGINHPQFSFKRYTHISEIPALVEEKIATIL